MEKIKVIRNLETIKRIFQKQIEIGIKTLSVIDDFQVDIIVFESEISQQNKHDTQIINLCTEITELNSKLPTLIEFDMICFMQRHSDLSETFALLKKDDFGWFVKDGIIDSKFSIEYNKKCLETSCRFTLQFAKNATMINENLISFSNGVLEICNKQPQQLDTTLFKTPYSKPCLIEFHTYLTKNNHLITPEVVWLAWFGYDGDKKPMKWNSSPTMLANVIKKICDGENVPVTKIAFKLPSNTKLSPDGHINTSSYGIAIESLIKRFN
ncbi:MAG: hypothetical protein WCG08_16425 [Paludibacter sp.]